MDDINSIPPPEEPEKALAAVVALRMMADRLERETIKMAITQGWTWSQIAEALGVTKQAVHKRHAKSISNNKVKKKGG